jgi:hypothetical protein
MVAAFRMMMVLLVAAAYVASATALFTCPTTETHPRLFLNVNWTCPGPFDCLTQFCSCVGGTLSAANGVADCTSYNASVQTIELCAAVRVTCVLTEALHPTSQVPECQMWARPLQYEYSSFYYSPDRSMTNLTQSCMEDACQMIQSASADVAPTVNYGSVCSLLNFTFPVPEGGGGGGFNIFPQCGQPQMYLVGDVAKACPNVHTNCEPVMCECTGVPLVNGSCGVKIEELNISTFERCAPRFFACVANSAIEALPPQNAAPADDCQRWASWVVYEYANYYFAPNSAVRLNSSFYRECTSSMCNIEMSYYNSTGDFQNICGGIDGSVQPPFNPYSNGGGSNQGPSDPHCNANYNRYFSNSVPWQCSGPSHCLESWCTCGNASWINGSCTSQSQFADLDHLERCATAQFNCMVSAAISTFPQNNYNQSNPCDSWSSWVVHEYAQYYYNSTNKETSSLFNSCASTACNFAYPLFNTSGNSSRYCGFQGVPQPPYNPNNQGGGGGGFAAGCVAPSSLYLENMPNEQCPNVGACVSTFCTCAGGVPRVGGDCTFTAPPTLATAKACFGAAITCAVRNALAYYVPGADEFNANPCVAWSVGVARDYVEWHAAGTDKTQTKLFQACNATACNLLVGNLNAAASELLTPCSFAGLTGAPTYVAPNPCPFVCPDNTCARRLSQCGCTANAVLSAVNTSFERPIAGNSFLTSNALSAFAYGSYGIPTVGNCSTYDFTPFMRYEWQLSNATAVVVAVNGSSIRIPAGALRPGVSYTLSLVVLGLLDSVRDVRSWTFTAAAPPPVVSITRQGSVLRLSNMQAFAINTFIQDAVPGESPAFNWSCAVVNSSDACAALTNSTIQRLWLPVNFPAGTYEITFSYKNGAASSTVVVTVVAEEIPRVRILMTSTPLVVVPVTYLPSQMIQLAASVSFNGSVTIAWRLNGGSVVSTNRTLTVNAANLNENADNTIVVRVTSASNAAVFGEASLSVAITPSYTLSMVMQKNGDNVATSATALSDKLLFTPTSSIVTGPSGSSFQFVFGFFTATRFTSLRATPSGSGFVADAPVPTGSGSAVAVVFSVSLRINGIDAKFFNQTFTINKPDTSAAASQIANAGSVTDPAVALELAGNLRALMSENASMAAAMAGAMVTMLTNSVKDVASLSGDQQGAIFDSLSSALGAGGSSQGESAAALLSNIVSSANFDPANGGAALNAIAAIDVKKVGNIIGSLAAAMANDPNLPVGETKTISSNGVTLALVKQSAADFGNTQMATGSATLTVPAGIQLDGVSSDDIIGVASAALSSNPFNASNGANPQGGVISYDFTLNGGSKLNVTGLATPIQIGMGAGSATAVCKYWDAASGSWSTTDVETRVVNGVTTCFTKHLTTFGSFPPSSSASGVALSLLVALLVVLAQTMM